MKRRVGLALVCFLALGAAAWLSAQENGDCLACHGDTTLSTRRAGQRVSLYVAEKGFAASVHGGLACIACHADLEGSDFPHAEQLKKVQCGSCHDREAKLHAESLHGRALARGDSLAPDCQTCHGRHDILPVKSVNSAVSPMRIPMVCGRCHREGSPVQLQRDIHQDHILENFSESIHGEGLLKKGLVVSATCTSCHTAHHILPHTDPRSSIARRNIAATCSVCHSLIETVHRKIIKGELWEKERHVLPACVDCHQPHKVRKVFYEQGMADRDCLTCHAKPAIKAAKDGRSLFVDAARIAASRHAKTACAQCHSDVSPSHVRPCETIARPVNCGACHAEVSTQYQASRHGQLAAAKDGNAPTCTECHGTHGVLGKRDPQSPIFAIHIPNLCARCHREGQKAAVRYQGGQHDILPRYTESIHGKGLLKSGLVVTATCTGCHTAHGELPAADPASSVNRANIAATCAQCHHGIYETFLGSVHAGANAKPGQKMPICSDCHSAHAIVRTDVDSFKLTIMETCGKCHEEIAKTYFDTYHGKVSQQGYTRTAKCYDCHGAHDILPVTDPRSRLSRQNVVRTCQTCHPQAGRRFAGYLTHATHHDPKKYPWLFYTFWFMTILVIVTFTVSGIHTLLWLPRALQIRRRLKKAVHDPNARQFQRFSRHERVMHILMILSFISLAVTGLTLKFSYAPFASTVSHLLGGFKSAGYIHRVAAATMIGIFIFHLFDLLFVKRKRIGSLRKLVFGPDSLMFNRNDAREFWASLKWFVGLGPRPAYRRWTYWEKFDYFAVFWGMAVIGSTGMMLWLPELFTRVLPGWLINVATIVHSDEALLAAGFIFTVHFFNTHLRPEKFPMDTVIFTGRMPLEELREDKPAEYEALLQAGTLEQHMVEPLPEIVVKAFKVFAWSALIAGSAIVVWIIYAMLFAYK